MRNAFSRNGFVFDRNFFEILKIFCSQTPDDLVLGWFRHRNGPDGQVKSASIDPRSRTEAHLRSRMRFWASGAFKMTPGSVIWVCGWSWGHHRSGCLRDFAPRGLFLTEISRNAKRRETSVFESNFKKCMARARARGQGW